MDEKRTDLVKQQEELLMLRQEIGLNRKDFALLYGIPLRTIEDLEYGKRRMPDYLYRLLAYKVRIDAIETKEQEGKSQISSRNVNIICDVDGRKIVLINDIRFKSRRSISWVDIEVYLKEYIGQCFEIAESSEKIYIGTDFPDEFSYSIDTRNLKGANEKAKANILTAVGELIQIATNKAEAPDYENKHKSKAKYGWYRYDTRFGIPVYDDTGEILRYNIFSTRMLVRCAKDKKLYLYDFIRTKKETSKPLEQ